MSAPHPIAELDRRYSGSVPEPELDGDRTTLLARSELPPERAGVYRSLPTGTARLAHALRSQNISEVRLPYDVDGLEDVLTVSGTASTVVISVPGPEGWLTALQDDVDAGLTVAARVRAPFDGWWKRVCEGATLLHYRRDCEHYVAAGPMTLDGGGDHWIVRGIASDALSRDVVPRHAFRDFDGLDPKRCNAESLDGFLRSVVEGFPESVSMSKVLQSGEDAISAATYFESGVGFHTELSPKERHLLITFAPYAPTLETTVVSQVHEHFGLLTTRSRPIRTLWTPTEMIF